MADDIDLANDMIDGEVERALRKLRQTAAKSTKGASNCFECGDKMPGERQKLGFTFCVPCASESERRKSLFAEY